MSSNRVFWAVEALGFAPLGSQTYIAAKGVQSVGITTSFNLQPVFELGQSAVYQILEDIPDVQMTMEKVLDGYPLLYHLATYGSSSATLFGRSPTRTNVALSIFPDTNDSASGAPNSMVMCSGMYVSSISYSFPVEGPFKESLTLVGNNKLWSTSATFSGGFTNTDRPLALTSNSGGVQRRANMLFDTTGIVTTDVNGQLVSTPTSPATILPPDVAGINSNGSNTRNSNGNYGASIQNITVSCNLGREAINELGHKNPYFRFMSLPVEVTTEIEVLSKSGDWISATEAGIYSNGNNTRTSTIKIATQEGTFIDLGTQNQCNNVTMTGGDTGGGQQNITYSFVTWNFFSVYADQDPTGALAQ